MPSANPRILLALASVLQLLGGLAHASAFPRASAALATTNLTPFFSASFKALWLADSTTMLALATVLGALAIRPGCATRPIVLLLSLIPFAVARLIYTFLGGFFAGHLLLTNAVIVFAAGLRFPKSSIRSDHSG